MRERPRIDVVEALEQGIVIHGDGFWERLRAECREAPLKRGARLHSPQGEGA